MQSMISTWVHPTGARRARSVSELLQSLPTILPDLVPAGVISGSDGQPLGIGSPFIDVCVKIVSTYQCFVSMSLLRKDYIFI